MQTQRLSLRPLLPTDGAALAHLYRDPEVARYIGGDLLTAESAQRQADRFAALWHQHGFGQSIVTERTSGVQIGRVGLHLWREWDEVELARVLARDWHGQGLAQQAARAWLAWAISASPADYLTAVVHEDNSASHRLAERLGFVVDRHDTTTWNPVIVWRYDLPRSSRG
ncbi:MAG: GNAT family N-acetyltransferase [Terracoccus sp.]